MGAELRVQRPDLDADVAAADHHQTARHLGECQRAGRIDHALVIELEPRDLDRPRSGGQHDVVGVDGRLGFSVIQLDGAWPDKPSCSRPVVAAVRLQKLPDPAGQFGHDVALPRLHLLHVDANVVGQKAHVRAVLQLVVVLGRGDQGLGRDAADVQANAPGSAFSTTSALTFS